MNIKINTLRWLMICATFVAVPFMTFLISGRYDSKDLHVLEGLSLAIGFAGFMVFFASSLVGKNPKQ